MHKRCSERLLRKKEHLELAKVLSDGPLTAGFEGIALIHQAASPLGLEDIDLSTSMLTKKLNVPLLINAITGGPEETAIFNASLARVAKELGIGMAVGSQQLALDDSSVEKTFTIARMENPNGLILANLSAVSSPKAALEAIEMLEADGIQLHLNLAQELAMTEGDKDFKGVLDNIAHVVEAAPVPVIIKEVGFGLSSEVAHQLWQCGVRYLDVGGQGGTNFGAIERYRQGEPKPSVFERWGIPTAISIAEVTALSLPLTVIASGGIRDAIDAMKSFALGADLVAIAGPLVKLLLNYSEQELLNYFNQFISDLRSLMFLTGSSSVPELKELPVIFTGKTKDWLEQRGHLNHFQQKTIIASKEKGRF